PGNGVDFRPLFARKTHHVDAEAGHQRRLGLTLAGFQPCHAEPSKPVRAQPAEQGGNDKAMPWQKVERLSLSNSLRDSQHGREEPAMMLCLADIEGQSASRASVEVAQVTLARCLYKL